MLDILNDEEGALGEVLTDNIVEHRRWVVVHKLIFSYKDKTYEAYYEAGATEEQWCPPWETDTEVGCAEVRQVEKTIKVWEKA